MIAGVPLVQLSHSVSIDQLIGVFILFIYLYIDIPTDTSIRTMKANIGSDVPLFQTPHKNFKYDVKALID